MDIIGILALTLQTIGGILVGFTALRVHHRVLHEHTIDEKVFRTMRSEQRIGILGIILIAIGYFLYFI